MNLLHAIWITLNLKLWIYTVCIILIYGRILNCNSDVHILICYIKAIMYVSYVLQRQILIQGPGLEEGSAVQCSPVPL